MEILEFVAGVYLFIKSRIATSQSGPVMLIGLSYCVYCMDVFMWSSILMHQPGMVANPDRGQLNRKNEIPLCPRSRLKK